MYQTRNTKFIMDMLTAPYLWCLLLLLGSAFAFSWRCWLPTADFQTNCSNNLIIYIYIFIFFILLNRLSLALLLADVTVWDGAPFPWPPALNLPQNTLKSSTVPPLAPMLLPLLCLCIWLFLSAVLERRGNHISP